VILYPEEPEARNVIIALMHFRPSLEMTGVTVPTLHDLRGEVRDAIRRLETLAQNIDNEIFDRQIEPEPVGA
jgi:hypothetical protein